MNAKGKVKVEGLKDILAKVSSMGKDVVEECALELEAAAYNMNNRALINIKTEGLIGVSSFLRQGQVVEKISDYHFEVINKAYYAPFQEFGTGAKVQVPAEWQGMAEEARNSAHHGTFEKFVESIAEWMHIKGIQPRTSSQAQTSFEEANYKGVAWLIAINILHNGLKARPFLYPAFVAERKELIKNLKAVIKRATS